MAEPKSVQVHIAAGTGLEIEWQDEHRSYYSFSYLRSVCPCAECSVQRAAKGRQPGVPYRLRFDELANLGAPVQVLKAEPVGKYALRFHWSDGHQVGDYSWHFLREVCPCASCCSARGA
jgi:DUF971 family protein